MLGTEFIRKVVVGNDRWMSVNEMEGTSTDQLLEWLINFSI